MPFSLFISTLGDEAEANRPVELVQDRDRSALAHMGRSGRVFALTVNSAFFEIRNLSKVFLSEQDQVLFR